VTKLREITEVLWQHISRPIPEQGKWLKQVLVGYYAYILRRADQFAVDTCLSASCQNDLDTNA
jgi:hypothetical protein